MSGSRWSSVGGVAAIALALLTGSCSSGGGGVGAGKGSKDGGPTGSGSSSGGPSGDATAGCTTDMDCAASVPPTMVAAGVGANCAAGKCNALLGVCEYVAKDEDGDGHAASNCVSTNGVPIQEGDDCNDQDANLYPGHPEACTTAADGGTPAGTLCVSGSLTCLPNGTESPCTGTVSCVNQTCSNGMCEGNCAPGQTMCTSDTQVEMCGPNGQWGVATTCTNACVGMVGVVGGTCGGVCLPGTQACYSDTQLETCSTSGTWGAPSTCTNACVGTVGTAPGSCGGVCVPGATQCAGNGVETCGDGTWGNATACSSSQTCAGGVCGTPPLSCQTSGPGLTNCGAASENCCASLEVTGGTYYRTYTNSGSGPTGEADPATVSGFRMDKYLVTVGRFRQFVNAWNNGSGYMPAAGSGKHAYLNGGQGLANSGSTGTYETGWDATDWNNTTDIDPTTANLTSCSPYSTWTASAGSQESLPINCVNWYEAYAFCIWDGGFLPSEAEWEYAAGGSNQLEYPWGSTAPGTGNQYAIYGVYGDGAFNCYYPSGAAATCTGVANIAPVGTATLGAGLWGQLDLAGEVFEWNLDWYDVSYVDPGTNCAYLTASSGRVVRGGEFDYDTSNMLPPNRNNDAPSNRDDGLGLRCSRTP
jgi:sulfatase modifying factor 1